MSSKRETEPQSTLVIHQGTLDQKALWVMPTSHVPGYGPPRIAQARAKYGSVPVAWVHHEPLTGAVKIEPVEEVAA